jgi:hypothetical protein
MAKKFVAFCFITLCAQSHSLAQCSNTSYGSGVTCVQYGGGGGAITNESQVVASFSPTAGHAVIATAYQCWDSGCLTTGSTTMTIGDNIHNPESCFVASPHSPFTLVETSTGAQHLQEYLWVCPSIPSGVNSFQINCSSANSCSYMAITVSEWTGLASSNLWDVDGGAASTVRQTTATLTTSTATNYTNELLYTFLDNSGDEQMTAVSPYSMVLQFFRGNANTGRLETTTGVKTAQTTWTPADDWYGAIGAIRTSASQTNLPAAPTGLQATPH